MNTAYTKVTPSLICSKFHFPFSFFTHTFLLLRICDTKELRLRGCVRRRKGERRGGGGECEREEGERKREREKKKRAEKNMNR